MKIGLGIDLNPNLRPSYLTPTQAKVKKTQQFGGIQSSSSSEFEGDGVGDLIGGGHGMNEAISEISQIEEET